MFHIHVQIGPRLQITPIRHLIRENFFLVAFSISLLSSYFIYEHRTSSPSTFYRRFFHRESSFELMMIVPLKRALASNWAYDDESSTLNLTTWTFTITAVSTIAFIIVHRMYYSGRKLPHLDEVLLAITGVRSSGGSGVRSCSNDYLQLLDLVQAGGAAWLLTKGYSMSVHDMDGEAMEMIMKVCFSSLTLLGANKSRPDTSNRSSIQPLSPWPRSRPSEASRCLHPSRGTVYTSFSSTSSLAHVPSRRCLL